MGIDFGLKRVGIAVSDPMRIIAQGFDTLANDSALSAKILDIVKKMSVSKIVVGKPLKLSGKEGDSAIEASKFARKLRERLSREVPEEVEVVEWDERFTTTIAQRTQIELGVRKKDRQKKGNLDRMASQLILQSYLDSHPRSNDPSERRPDL
ncbi:MAG: Holliday junction resolvase RuvX [Bacteroidetes bacterium]|jgi:putative Holliday junction resolvase|nr:Holliday junction resolvase RuvX [Bacteroidota bacterium]